MSHSLGTLHGHRCIYKGMLLKRCHLSWRPRHVELISEPKDISGHNYSFQLHIYEPQRRQLKNRIKMADIVTISSSMDYYFQIFLMSGKVLQLKADTVERQAQWMAMLKVGLGKGSIFHVQVNTTNNLEHALLYSIGVNLPAHRVGQLDRVLVLASPINDINLHAWDLNRVQRFLQLDIGVRMELCTQCLRNKQERSITFIMERMFISDCVKFLCSEARISEPPFEEGGFVVYSVPHKCFSAAPPTDKAPPPPPPPLDESFPPPYSKTSMPPPIMPKGIPAVEHDYDTAEYMQTAASSNDSFPPSRDLLPPKRSNLPDRNTELPKKSGFIISAPNTHEVNSSAEHNNDLPRKPLTPIFQFPDEVWEDYSSGSGSSGGKSLRTSSFTESLFLSDGVLTKTTTTTSTRTFPALPPRTIPRKNHGTSIPATTHVHSNFQPHLFNNAAGKSSMETPYQISSRIIITDSGELQYERNVLGNTPGKMSGGLRFRKTIPLPPRASKASSNGGTGKTGLAPESNSQDKRGFYSETDVHSEANGRISISTTVTSNANMNPASSSPHAQASANSTSLTHSDSNRTESPAFTGVRTERSLDEATSVLDGRNADFFGSTTSSSTHIPSSPRATPISQATPISVSPFPKKSHLIRPLPPLLNRTTSESRGQKDRVHAQQHKRPSFTHTRKSTTSQSSVENYEDDCYVIVTPLSKSPTPVSPAISPSYVHETQLLEQISERSKCRTEPDQNEQAENGSGRRLSLADAGGVIRQDWMASRDALRQEEALQVAAASQPNVAGDHERLNLEEIALHHYKKKLEQSKLLSCGEYLDSDVFLEFDSSTPLAHSKAHARGQSAQTHWRTDSTSSSEAEVVSDEDLEGSVFLGMPSHLAGHTHHHQSAESASLGRGVANQVGVSPRRGGVKKPVVTPRRSVTNSTSNSLERFNSGSTSACSSSSQFRSSSTLDSRVSSHNTEHKSAQCGNYLPNSIPVPANRKPVPVPRTGMKPSMSASMVTMGISHLSSSEGDILDAVFKDSLSPGDAGQWAGQMHHKFHSSTELNSQSAF